MNKKYLIGVLLSLGMAVAIACLGWRTRHDPFPPKPAAGSR